MNKHLRALFLLQALQCAGNLSELEKLLADCLSILADQRKKDSFFEMVDHADIILCQISNDFNKEHYDVLISIRRFIDDYK